jgi:hypothetical protein
MQNQTIFQKLNDMRERCRSLSHQEDIFKDGIIKIKIEDLDWLIGTIERQQREIGKLTNIKEIEVYDNGYARIEYQDGETKVTSKVVYMDAILTGVTECDDDDTAIDPSKVVLHQKEDGTLQLRDDISFLWCVCGNPAVEYVKENESPYQYLCNKCFKELQEQLEAIDRLRK